MFTFHIIVGFRFFKYFDLHFQWFFNPSLKFKPEWPNWFLSSCGILSLVWDISFLGIWNWVPASSLGRAAAPWVSTHTQ
jgi:hypothetical protein